MKLYRYVKGFYLYENGGTLGKDLVYTMSELLNEKAVDINVEDLEWDICNYGMVVNYLEVYKDYSYGSF